MNGHNRKRQQAKGSVQGQRVVRPEIMASDKKSKNKYAPWPTIPRSMDPWNKEYRKTVSNTTTSMTTSATAAGSSSAIPNHHTTGNSGSFDNAPTSLSNLAQLSGITLLPMSNQRHVSSNTAKNQHVFSNHVEKQSKFSNEASKSSSYKIHQSKRTQHPQSSSNPRGINSNQMVAQTNSIGTSTRASKSEVASHNIIHLPDGQSAAISSPGHSRTASSYSALVNKNKSKPSSGVVKHRANMNYSPSNASISDPRRSHHNGSHHETDTDNSHQLQQPTLLLGNNIQLIPVSEPYRSDSYLSNDGSYLISNHSMKSTNKLVDDNVVANGNTNINLVDEREFGITNDSLIQLMAVLSNPALTITPVDMSAMKNTTNLITDIDTMENIGEATITAVSMPTDVTPRYLDDDLESNDLGELNQANARLPKSAANLQMVYGGCSPDPLDCWSNAGSPSHCPIDSQTPDTWQRQTMPDDEDHEDSSQVAMIDDSVDDIQSKNYKAISDSVKNLILSQRTSDTTETPTVSVQLLRLLAEQTREINQPEELSKKADVPRENHNLSELGRGMKEFLRPSMVTSPYEIVYVDEECLKPKTCKQKLSFNKRRLYVPSNDPKRIRLDNDNRVTNLKINIESIESQQKFYLSEKHQVLEDIRTLKNISGKKIQSDNELPRDRSLELSSRITANIEKRKRIETILKSQDGNDPPNDVDDLDFDYAGVLSFYDPSDAKKLSNDAKFLTPILYYEEPTTPEKESFMRSVGLLSRFERNKLLLSRCEKKMRTYTALALEQTQSLSSDVQRFAQMIEQTGGSDIQMKIDTNIKRNDLPLLEGLNRNTSRIKINYMSLLGLDKRSKRTTLYKVGRNSESSTSQEQKSQPQSKQETAQRQPKHIPTFVQNDLSNKTKCSATERPQLVSNNLSKAEPLKESGSGIVPILFGLENFNRAPLSTIALSCREAMNKPSKQDYMRSLGLISS